MNRLKLAEALVASAVNTAAKQADKLSDQANRESAKVREQEQRAEQVGLEAHQAREEQRRVEAILSAVQQV